MEKLTFTAKQSIDIVKFLQKHADLNFNQVQSLLRKSDIKINGKKIKQNTLVNAEDFIEVFLPDKKVEVVFADKNVVIAKKPAKTETTGNDGLEGLLKKQYAQIYPVHRLDRNTRGLVVFALNKSAETELLNAFKNRQVNKIYQASVFGILKQKSGELIHYLQKDANLSQVKVFSEKKSDTTLAKLCYNVVSENNGISTVEIKLLTGKTHQIRCQFAYIGHPLVGDNKYGNKNQNKQHQSHFQQLVAKKLSFNFDKNSILYYLNNQEFNYGDDLL